MMVDVDRVIAALTELKQPRDCQSCGFHRAALGTQFCKMCLKRAIDADDEREGTKVKPYEPTAEDLQFPNAIKAALHYSEYLHLEWRGLTDYCSAIGHKAVNAAQEKREAAAVLASQEHYVAKLRAALGKGFEDARLHTCVEAVCEQLDRLRECSAELAALRVILAEKAVTVSTP